MTCGVSQHRDEKFPLTGGDLSHHQEFARLHKSASLNPVEVDTARHPACIPHYRMIPRLLSLINQHRHLASKRIENRQSDIAGDR